MLLCKICFTLHAQMIVHVNDCYIVQHESSDKLQHVSSWAENRPGAFIPFSPREDEVVTFYQRCIRSLVVAHQKQKMRSRIRERG